MAGKLESGVGRILQHLLCIMYAEYWGILDVEIRVSRGRLHLGFRILKRYQACCQATEAEEAYRTTLSRPNSYNTGDNMEAISAFTRHVIFNC
jgi:hypothetical protein